MSNINNEEPTFFYKFIAIILNIILFYIIWGTSFPYTFTIIFSYYSFWFIVIKIGDNKN